MQYVVSKEILSNVPQHLHKISTCNLETIGKLNNDTQDFHCLQSFSFLNIYIQNQRKDLKALQKRITGIERITQKNMENTQTLIENSKAQKMYLQYLTYRNQ
ncbi:Hypothetical_protein [Hexamita inflata]|uniref:Hypothetical_protein n=1 Tax=Hexamita inflata TaxID=28002 RepID=A0AA86P4S6_9EUKA|nr:Hypothetical protein HINF_LOCUS18458 [Hexamita inflata]